VNGREPGALEVSHLAKTSTTKKGKRKCPRCKTCGKTIRVSQGWSPGSAVRKHYWSKHPERMLGTDGGGR